MQMRTRVRPLPTAHSASRLLVHVCVHIQRDNRRKHAHGTTRLSVEHNDCNAPRVRSRRMSDDNCDSTAPVRHMMQVMVEAPPQRNCMLFPRKRPTCEGLPMCPLPTNFSGAEPQTGNRGRN
eukprot:14097851-Alexandrium_andersonii.AAC.1